MLGSEQKSGISADAVATTRMASEASSESATRARARATAVASQKLGVVTFELSLRKMRPLRSQHLHPLLLLGRKRGHLLGREESKRALDRARDHLARA